MSLTLYAQGKQNVCVTHFIVILALLCCWSTHETKISPRNVWIPDVKMERHLPRTQKPLVE